MFNTDIPFYSIMILLSLLSNIIIVLIIYKKFNFTTDEIIGALVYENIGIIVGAKLLTYLHNFSTYGKFDFLSLGLSSYGGIIGAIICLIIFAIQFKKKFKDIFFTFMPSIPLMYSIGKIGCFLAGCCYGIKYNGIGHVIYNYSASAPKGIALFPVQLLETISFLLIFIYMFKNILKNKFTYKTLGIGFILSGLIKFILDFFRNSHINVILSLNQILSIIFIIIGITIIKIYHKSL